MSLAVLFSIPALIIIFLLILKRSEYGLVLLVFWWFISEYIWGLQDRGNFLLFSALGAAAIIYLTYQSLFFKNALLGKTKFTLREKHISFLMVLFFMWTICSVCYGFLKGNNIKSILGDFYHLSTIPLVYFLTIISVKDEKQCTKVFNIIILLICIFFVMDLVKYGFGVISTDVIVAGILTPRLLTFSASFSLMVFPLALSFYLFFDRKKWLHLVVTCLALLVLIASFTRTYWYASIGGFMFMFLLLSLREKITFLRKILPLLLIAFLLGSFMLFNLNLDINLIGLVSSRITAFNPANKFVEVRDIFSHAVENPLFILMGNGMGGTIQTWVVGAEVDEIMVTHFIHNNYARIFLETGIVGLFLYLTMVILFLKKTIVLFRRIDKKDCFAKSLTLGTITSFVTVLIGAIGTNTLFNIFTYILMGMVMVITRHCDYKLQRKPQQV